MIQSNFRCYYQDCSSDVTLSCICKTQKVYTCLEHIEPHIKEQGDHNLKSPFVEVDINPVISLLLKILSGLRSFKLEISKSIGILIENMLQKHLESVKNIINLENQINDDLCNIINYKSQQIEDFWKHMLVKYQNPLSIIRNSINLSEIHNAFGKFYFESFKPNMETVYNETLDKISLAKIKSYEKLPLKKIDTDLNQPKPQDLEARFLFVNYKFLSNYSTHIYYNATEECDIVNVKIKTNIPQFIYDKAEKSISIKSKKSYKLEEKESSINKLIDTNYLVLTIETKNLFTNILKKEQKNFILIG
jgi:tyrosyl-tRNA synthetase